MIGIKFWLNGGSKKTKSKGLLFCLSRKIIESLLFSWYWKLSRSLKLDSRLLKTMLFFSIKQTFLAPLDIASRLRAPLPAKGSIMVLSAILNWSQLKRVSLVLPGVGRSPSASGKLNFLPLRFPAIILKVLSLIGLK